MTLFTDSSFLTKAAMMLGISTAALVGWLLYVWKAPFKGTLVGDAEYEKMSAEKKMQLLYSRCEENGKGKTQGFPTTKELLWDFIVKESFAPTIHYHSDEIYKGQFKGVHPVGNVAMGVFESSGDHNYTGVLSSKANPILIRMSHAGRPNEENNIPAMAIKFLRDGLPSVNIMGLHSFEGITNGNFFSVDLTNHLHQSLKARDRFAQHKFDYFSPHSLMVGLNDFGDANQDGTMVPKDERVFPFQLRFVPNPSLAESTAKRNLPSETSIKDIFDPIPSGTVLYTVLACAEPGAPAKKIGVVRTTSPLIASLYGDKTLFFRHISMEADLKLRPKWHDAVRAWK
eukprot:TRINITY_DN16730_c3_g1_i1.p1 TRINITY_DN16730_c3_g1~~TRINITY_DN16730_c3_g1_i1.p1  ORF type:complete len:342 (+),score=60.32 TRINITY_DN16730_c3_g1_i1:64-1089(+)